MNSVSSFFFAVGAFLLLQSDMRGAEAFFSPDGKTVITTVAMPSNIGSLAQIDIASGKVTPIALPAAFANEDIDSVARGADGEILFLAKNAVWVLKKSEAPRKVVSTDPVKNPTDLFVATKKGGALLDWLLISGTEDEKDGAQRAFYARKPGGKNFKSVFCRRVENATSGAFAADGRMFFASGGDLWEGHIDPESEGEVAGTLIGERIAAVAFANTDMANAGSLSLEVVCPAGKWIYCALGGHHMAAVIRTPRPTNANHEHEGQGALQASYRIQAQVLGGTEVIADLEDSIHGFCATEVDGKPLVFYYMRSNDDNGDGRPLMLWKGSGAPKVIGHLPKSKE